MVIEENGAGIRLLDGGNAFHNPRLVTIFN